MSNYLLNQDSVRFVVEVILYIRVPRLVVFNSGLSYQAVTCFNFVPSFRCFSLIF